MSVFTNNDVREFFGLELVAELPNNEVVTPIDALDTGEILGVKATVTPPKQVLDAYTDIIGGKAEDKNAFIKTAIYGIIALTALAITIRYVKRKK